MGETQPPLKSEGDPKILAAIEATIDYFLLHASVPEIAEAAGLLGINAKMSEINGARRVALQALTFDRLVQQILIDPKTTKHPSSASGTKRALIDLLLKRDFPIDTAENVAGWAQRKEPTFMAGLKQRIGQPFTDRSHTSQKNRRRQLLADKGHRT